MANERATSTPKRTRKTPAAPSNPAPIPATEPASPSPPPAAGNPLFARISAALDAGHFPIRIGGAMGSAAALAVLAIAKAASAAGRSVLCIAEGTEAAEGLAADVGYLAENPPVGVRPLSAPVKFFPALSAVPTDDDPVPSAMAQARLDFLTTALTGDAFTGIASVRALLQRLVMPGELSQTHLNLAVGHILDPEKLVREMVTAGFVHSPMVEWPGEISYRGGIVDIFPHAASNPWRIEFFGDEIVSLRAFDATSQSSFSTVERVNLFLAGDPASLHGDSGRVPKAASLLDYLPADAVIVVCEPHVFHERAERALRGWPQRPVFRGGEAAWKEITARPCVELFELPQGETGIDLGTRSSEPYSGDPDHIVESVALLRADIGEIRLLARTEPEAKRLREIFAARNCPIAPDDPQAKIAVAIGELDEGFVCPAADFACLQHVELLQKTRRRRSLLDAVQRTEAIHDYLDLGIGDFVVHVSHGIARYRGMKELSRDGITGEFLELEFDGGTILYVSALNISLVQKYIGAKGHVPELSKIGGKRWSAKKAAVEAAVLGMANDFLALQAERATLPGMHVPPDDEMVHDFIAAFPYEETPDQERADREILGDMVTERPMDRLLCGDVGYGKTEVAMRATMRAVNAGFQVAVLVPTTVLAEQHFATFTERFTGFPIVVERLSRFRNAGQIRDTLARLKAGGIDVLIGTHRLLSKDVRFNNLGLVVVDEEQRFGVEHKDRLKFLRRNVDVLTLTATPIPRTLHMALLGIRDISNLTTAPHERLAVHTEVRTHDDDLIRDSIRRELDRDGQVFFIHNRVQDIHLVAARVQELVPEARLEFAHGQMPETRLQSVMAKFVRGEIDVLVATTIVESGLDIPTANTLFVNRADRFGLAELHQLRGRVGRYKHRAYAYFLVDPHAPMNPDAKKRLRAIAEFSHLGAGFNIAMRDLEIRGAGNIIGEEQSGHIAAVGYDLYCKLLQQAIATVKHETPDLPIEGLQMSLQLGMDMRVPERYIPDRRQRLDAYRRLFGAGTMAELRASLVAIRDRYGAPPTEVRRLIDAARLRINAGKLGVKGFRLKPGDGVFLTIGNMAALEPVLVPYKWRVAVVDGDTLFVRIERHEQGPDQLLKLLLKIFTPESTTGASDDFDALL